MFPLLLPLRLWPYLRRQRWRVFLAVLTVLPDPLLMVGIPVLLQLVIDRVLADQGGIEILPLLLLPCAWLLVAVFLSTCNFNLQSSSIFNLQFAILVDGMDGVSVSLPCIHICFCVSVSVSHKLTCISY